MMLPDTTFVNVFSGTKLTSSEHFRPTIMYTFLVHPKNVLSVSVATNTTFITSFGENDVHGANDMEMKISKRSYTLKEKKQTNCISFFVINTSLRFVIFLFIALTVTL